VSGRLRWLRLRQVAGLAAEAVHPGGLAEDDRRGRHAAAGHGQQRGSQRADQVAQFKDRTAALRLLRRRLSDTVVTALRVDQTPARTHAPARPLAA
jgi:hypothetical protein